MVMTMSEAQRHLLRMFFLPVGDNGDRLFSSFPFARTMLLSGPPTSCKTSLLLQFAYNCASESSSMVVFLCKSQGLERRPPLLAEGVEASSENFERVHMKYVEDDDGIRKYFAAFHLQEKFPKVVIIDDFCEFFNEWKCRESFGQTRGKEIAIIKTLALCRDAVDYANKKMTSDAYCKLLISDTYVGDGPRLLYIYQRWLSTIFTIQSLDTSTFLLKTRHIGPNNQGEEVHARYSTSQQCLKLEGLN